MAIIKPLRWFSLYYTALNKLQPLSLLSALCVADQGRLFVRFAWFCHLAVSRSSVFVTFYRRFSAFISSLYAASRVKAWRTAARRAATTTTATPAYLLALLACAVAIAAWLRY